ncbi:hypothetical protein [Hymenobacter psoromatis]|nr:hypothetical protein [Hymenobacter psoromatis]
MLFLLTLTHAARAAPLLPTPRYRRGLPLACCYLSLPPAGASIIG